MIYIIISAISGTVAIFTFAENLLNIAPIKSAKAFKNKNGNSQSFFTSIIDPCAEKLSRHLHINILRKAEYKKLLETANIPESPERYIAETIVYVSLFILAAIPLYFFKKALSIILLIGAAYVIYKRKHNLKEAKIKRVAEIEKELPRFVSYLNNIMRSDRNLINCINLYRKDYDTPLTKELAKTVADMNTGNSEVALQRLEKRVNSPYISSLTRGLIATLRGNDMSVYFDNLSIQLLNTWENRLRMQTMAKEPKIRRMSLLLFAMAFITLLIILVVIFKNTVILGMG